MWLPGVSGVSEKKSLFEGMKYDVVVRIFLQTRKWWRFDIFIWSDFWKRECIYDQVGTFVGVQAADPTDLREFIINIFIKVAIGYGETHKRSVRISW